MPKVAKTTTKTKTNERPAASKNNDDDDVETGITVEQAANAVREIIRLISADRELKVSLEDQINNIANATEYLLDEIDSIDTKSRKKFLLAYKEFLLRSMESIDLKLNEAADNQK